MLNPSFTKFIEPLVQINSEESKKQKWIQKEQLAVRILEFLSNGIHSHLRYDKTNVKA